MNATSIPATAAAITRTNRVLRNSYLLLAISLLPTIAGAALGAVYPIYAYMSPWIVLFAFLGVMFGFQAMIIRNRHSVAGIGWLLGFTLAMGYMIGPSIGFAIGNYSNGAELVATAVGGTAAIFFVLAGYATVTRRNFATPSIAKTLFIGMMMAFVLGIFNSMFFQVSAVSLAISAIFMLISSAYIVYTINNVVRGGETNYIMVTMTLFIMVLNLFQSLLHLLMAFAGNRE